MARIEFGIVDEIDPQKEYCYEPETYHCVPIDDEYVENWWPKLVLMKTYFHNLRRPEVGLAVYGITLIPPESLPALQDIVLADRRINWDDHLAALAELIRQAIDGHKFMIHFGL